ncbi:hypothetical protein MMC21_001829 [Puttea exsequens]|nr:hypothetical protein [Puttea exsequens]
MSGVSGKSSTTLGKEDVTPNSTKSTQHKLKQSMYGAAKDGQPGSEKSTAQALKEKAQGTTGRAGR